MISFFWEKVTIHGWTGSRAATLIEWNTNITMVWGTHESTIHKFNHCVHNYFSFIKLIKWKSSWTLWVSECAPLSGAHHSPVRTTLRCTPLSGAHHSPVRTTLRCAPLSGAHHSPVRTTIRCAPLSGAHHSPVRTTLRCAPLPGAHHSPVRTTPRSALPYSGTQERGTRRS